MAVDPEPSSRDFEINTFVVEFAELCSQALNFDHLVKRPELDLETCLSCRTLPWSAPPPDVLLVGFDGSGGSGSVEKA